MKKNTLIKILAAALCTGLITSSASFPGREFPVKATDGTENTTVPNNTPPEMPDPSMPTQGAIGNTENATPPELPDGNSAPEIPGGAPSEMTNGEIPPQVPGGTAPGMGTESSSITLNGANTADGSSITYDGNNSSKKLSSENGSENAVLSTNGGTYTINNASISKTGDTRNVDNSNFYAVNAAVAAADGSNIYLSDSAVTSSAEGANAVFSTGNSTIYAKNITVNTSGNSSRGLDATYEGTIIASDVNITTSGDHCGAIATDRGGGNISVDGAVLNTSGQGSPLIYSTGVIEVTNAQGESTGSQIVGMEGLNTVRIKNSALTGSAKKASDPVANGVILYQSTSGDSQTGIADFEAADSTLTSYIKDGAMFYVTNTDADIILSNTVLDFDSESNTLLTAAGNNSNNWGTPGSNGGNVTFTAIQETLSGDISCDGISKVSFYLTDGSTYTGSIIQDTGYEGNGGVSMELENGTTWTVTKNCSLLSLTRQENAVIKDADGNTVTIKTADGTTVAEGTSPITITTGTYTEEISGNAHSISDFTVDRTGFDAYFSENSENTSAENSGDIQKETAEKPAKTTIKNIKALKNALKLSWKQISETDGYLIYRSTKKSGSYKKIATVKNATKTSYKDRTVKKNKKYYYKIRTYQTNDGSKVYGDYSAAKGKKL